MLEIQGDNIYICDVVDSTNKKIRSLVLEKGAGNGAVCIAREQTAGRGRLNRKFYSPPDIGIYMSVYIKTEKDISQLVSVSAVAAVAVCRAIEASVQKAVGIKWINDIYFEGRKAGGILCETLSSPDINRPSGVIIGVGINCFEHKGGYPEEIREHATALGLENEAQKNALALSLIDELREVDSYKREDWLSYYRLHSIVLGKQIIVRPNNKETFRAMAEEIDDSGALVVRAENGEYLTLSSGEISIRFG
jgi:BirA family biotin operon repressor/biotin-[acetyl-CoA-carboxylase] ligase